MSNGDAKPGGGWKESFRRAFAVDPPGAAEPTDDQRPVVEKVCAEVVRRHLTTPALMFLELSRPMNYVGAQVMHFFQPMVAAVLNAEGYGHFATFLERRGSIEYICRRIEHLEAKSDSPPQDQAFTTEDTEGHRECRRDDA